MIGDAETATATEAAAGPPAAPAHVSLQRLLAYWRSKRADRIAPPRSAIRPDEIVELLPDLVIFEVVGDPPRFRVRLGGTRVAAAFGDDGTGRFLEDLPFGAALETVILQMRAVVAARQPLVHQVEFTASTGRHVRYERLGLPLSTDGHAIDMLLCGYAMDESYQEHLPPPLPGPRP